jgi:hypothetical protein
MQRRWGQRLRRSGLDVRLLERCREHRLIDSATPQALDQLADLLLPFEAFQVRPQLLADWRRRRRG